MDQQKGTGFKPVPETGKFPKERPPNRPASGLSIILYCHRPEIVVKVDSEKSQNDYNNSRVYHWIRALPQVKPPPKAVKMTLSPRFIEPERTASSKAMAVEADDELPYL